MADSDASIANMALLNIGDTKGFIGSLDDPSDQAVACKLVYATLRDKLLRSFGWPFAARRAYPAQLGGAAFVAGTSYALGAYVSFVPGIANVANPPETLTTFVYLSLQAANLGNNPDVSPTWWRQISRAAYAYVFLPPGDLLKVNGLYHRGTRNPREDQQIPYAIEYEPAPGPGQLLFTDGHLPGESSPSSTSSTSLSIELEYTARVTDPHQFPPDFDETLAWAIAEKLALGLRKDPAEAKAAHTAYLEALNEAAANALQEVPREQQPVPSHIAARR